MKLRFLDALVDGSAPANDDPSPGHVAELVRLGVDPDDRIFDRFLPRELRLVSAQYWTPLAVAVRAARWLEQVDVRTVVDVGSGAGKFCVVAALVGGAHFTGVEQRGRLVGAARELAGVFGVSDRVSFLHGAFGEVPLIEAEAYYLYNPFEENLYGPDDRLDGHVELSDTRYARDIAAVEHLLRSARVGTYLLTYNGFGGTIPASYREMLVDRELPNVLRLWRKVHQAESGCSHRADAP